MVPEFLVCFDILEKMAAEYGLTLVKKMNFHEYFDDKIKGGNSGYNEYCKRLLS